ncbi:hypothetical protein POUND7_008109 [Theobroma cacao]
MEKMPAAGIYSLFIIKGMLKLLVSSRLRNSSFLVDSRGRVDRISPNSSHVLLEN